MPNVLNNQWMCSLSCSDAVQFIYSTVWAPQNLVGLQKENWVWVWDGEQGAFAFTAIHDSKGRVEV